MSKARAFSVLVEGNIGSGKTTFLNYFAAQHAAEVVIHPEPVDDWRNVRGHNLFQKMYEEPNRWSYLFQHYVQLSRARLHEQIYNPSLTSKVHIFERSLYSTMYCFGENLHRYGAMSDAEFVVEEEWFKYLTDPLRPNPIAVDLIVYLQTQPETVFNRIKARCRKEEKGIPLDYLTQLHKLHDEWLLPENRTQRSKHWELPGQVLVLNVDEEGVEKSLALYQKYAPVILGKQPFVGGHHQPTTQNIDSTSQELSDSRKSAHM